MRCFGILRFRGNIAGICFLLAFVALCFQGIRAFAAEPDASPFPGVSYVRWEKPAPEPQVAHIVLIALDTPGLRFLTTPSNGDEAPRETWCETTYEFVKKTGAQIGINGNYFIYDKEMHTELIGLAVSDGAVVSPWDKSISRYGLNISKDNRVAFVERPENAEGTTVTKPDTELYNAVSGRPMLLRDGKILVEAEGGERHPRTGIGLTGDNKLMLFVADGRQPSHSVGMTFHEMATVMLEHGAVNALALDGGGSSTLVLADPEPRVVNVPMLAELPVDVGLQSPGMERPNGNNLAVFVPIRDAK
jgi:hypothetical protein